MSKPKVLVTGMSGFLGGLVRQQLEGKYELSALNRSEIPGIETYQADVADFAAILPAFEHKDIVIHLAAVANVHATWEQVLPANVIGTYNVFEAARRAGVKRIIFASAGAAIAGWEQVPPYDALVQGRYDEVPENWPRVTHELPTWPFGLYGCSKVWGEALARHFVDTTDMSIICLRISAVSRQNRPTNTHQFSIWCSHRDVASAVEKCVAAPESVRFDIFFAVSDNKWGYRDIEHTREVIDFEPQDRAEDYR
ncbi:MAG: NAD(P)-dependent oxidoreductase [Chloroflexi bacterium]|nr:NAD(P)-dependent oxidoreductase [Chloroflexota bacterium]